MLKHGGLKLTGALVDTQRRLKLALFPPTPTAESELLLMSELGLTRLCAREGLDEAGTKEELQARDEGKSDHKTWLQRRLHAAIVR